MKNSRRVLSIALVFFLTFFVLAGIPSLSTAADRNDFLKVTFLEVGQGDCEIIRTPSGKVIMIDAGDDTEYAAENYILPYLEANGIKKIDTLFISHAHRDHIGGLLALIPKIEFGEVYENKASVSQIYADIIQMFKKKNVPVKKAYKGDKYDFGDGIEAVVLHPTKEWANGIGVAAKKEDKPGATRPLATDDATIAKKPKEDGASTTSSDVSAGEENLNNFSVTLRMQYKDIVYFFSGDAEKEAEDYMMGQNPESFFKATVYKVAHHGSKTSSTPDFLTKIKPMLSIISCGVDNKFKHPYAGTVKNLEFYSKNILRTDQDKTVETWTDGAEFHYSSSNTANALVTGPEVTNITPYSATIEWQTTHLSTSKVKFTGAGSSEANVKQDGDFELNHKVTITGLKPDAQYNFDIESVAKKDPAQLVTASGSFKTAAENASGVSIAAINIKPVIPIILEPVVINVKVAGAPAGAKVTLYEDCLTSGTVAGGPVAVGSGDVQFKWIPTQSKHYELIVTVSEGEKIYAVSSVLCESTRRRIVIDEAHANQGKGNYESMKMDLYNRGFELVNNSERINAATLKGASVLIISECATGEAGLNSNELTAIKKFIDAGGSLLMMSKCDFGGYSNPQTLNKVLEQVGSNIRFNDDEVLDPTNCPPGGNMAYLLFMHLFDKRVVSQDVSLILAKGSCSMINSKMKPITQADKTIIPLCYGDDDTYNIDADNQGDGVIYPKGVPVVVDAAEILPGGGKVATFGCWHVGSNVYTYSPSQQTQIYNYDVIKWLATPGKKRDVEELSTEMTYISEDAAVPAEGDEANQSAAISASIRADKLSAKLLEEFDYSSGKLEASTDNFLKFFGTGNVKKLNSFSDVIKKVLDRVRYEAAENPQLLDSMKDRINALEDLYNRSKRSK